MKTIWYHFVKWIVKTSLFFYTKKIVVKGKNNIPKKGAVLFMVNHPNGLLDPLIVATNNSRIQHFLVRAATFKNPMVKKLLATLNLMPIYRIRDGVGELSKNQEIFENCYQILKKGETLMIFPEGSHDKKRTVRPLSKGFTRIVFGAIEKHPTLTIKIVPVGLTYQNASHFPSKIALHYGKPIVANDYYKTKNQASAINQLKTDVSNSLQKLSVHISNDDNYDTINNQLVNANLDFTAVDYVNSVIETGNITNQPKKINWSAFLKPIVILNTLFPWLIWKKVLQKIDEIEFIDTFRFGLNTVLVPVFYLLQTYIVFYFFGLKLAGVYLLSSLFLLLLYTKLHVIPAK